MFMAKKHSGYRCTSATSTKDQKVCILTYNNNNKQCLRETKSLPMDPELDICNKLLKKVWNSKSGSGPSVRRNNAGVDPTVL